MSKYFKEPVSGLKVETSLQDQILFTTVWFLQFLLGEKKLDHSEILLRFNGTSCSVGLCILSMSSENQTP